LFFTTSSFLKIEDKIGGVNFVSPDSIDSFSGFTSVKRINANWIACNPYAFSRAEEPQVHFNYKESWWGEKTEGIVKMIQQAKKENYQVMLKPHVWVVGQGWCGDFDLKTEDDWLLWEKDYEAYILSYAKIASDHNVEMLCIGTEYKIAATKRASFWISLISKVRKIYSGKVTYAANWDNFHNITFWDELDFIGIDAYFPLSGSKDAKKEVLDLKWKEVSKTLEQYSVSYKKQIIFAEYGYKSIHYSAGKQWEIEHIKDDEQVNFNAQNNAYSSLYENVWKQPWFAGGFIWKWFPNDKKAGGLLNSDYTTQHKPVEQIIKQYY
jgi:hypothetical protein